MQPQHGRRAATYVMLLVLATAVACGGGSSSGTRPSLAPTPTRSLDVPSGTVAPRPTTAPPVAPPTPVTTPTPVATPTPVTTLPPTELLIPTPTPTPASETSDSGTSWGWWVALILVVALVVGGVLWGVIRRRRKWAAWRQAVGPVAEQTRVVTGLLPDSGQPMTDESHWRDVRQQVEHNAQQLDASAAIAPSQEATAVTQAVAGALRGVTSALEAERLLHQGAPPPSAEQLGQAEAATRHAHDSLQAAQTRLDELIRPPHN